MTAEDQQTCSLKFSQELTDQFDVVVGKTENGLQVAKDVAEFYRSRAKIEEEYAKKLAALYKSPPGAGFFNKDPAIKKEYQTLRDAVLGILEKGTKSSDVHQEFSNKINNEVCKALDTWIKTKTNDRAKIVAEGQKHSKIVGDAKGNAAKAKDNYEKLMKQLDAAIDTLKKAEKDELAAPDNKKLPPLTKKAGQAVEQLREKSKAADSAYQSAVTKANEEITSFRNEKMPIVLDNLQALEEERWNIVLNSVRQFKSAQEVVPTGLSEFTEELNGIAEVASIEGDFTEFINSNKKDKEADALLEYAPFKSKHEDEVQAEKPKEEKAEEKAPVKEEEKVPEDEKAPEPKKEEQPKREETPEEAKIKADLFGSGEDEDIFK